MKHKNIFDELSDEDIDSLLTYTIPYTEENRTSIKGKLDQKAAAKQRKPSFKSSSKRWIAVAAVVSLLVTSTLVYADILDFSRIYRRVFGEKAEYLEQHMEPFEGGADSGAMIRSEHDGIVLKLISVINDGDALRIFATMQDLTGDRLGESMSFSSWGLSQGQGGNVSVVDYDRETKTATLLITSLGGDQEGGAELVINGFSTERETVEGVRESRINLYELLQNHSAKTMSQDQAWGPEVGPVAAAVEAAGNQRKDSVALPESAELLQFDELDIKFSNADWAYISNAGFVDGRLHIQTAVTPGRENYLIDMGFANAENEIVFGQPRPLQFVKTEDARNHARDVDSIVSYTEWIYEEITDAEQLKDLHPVIGLWVEGNVVEGSWEFSFEIPEKVTTEFAVGEEINVNGGLLKVESIAISPLGITIELAENIASDYKHGDVAVVTYDDGTTITLKETYIGGLNRGSTLKLGGEILEVEKVAAVTVNGNYVVEVK